MAELLAIASQLGGVGFPTLLVGIIWGSYKGWWKWGKDYVDLETKYEARLLKSEISSNKWEAMALEAAGLVDKGITLARKSR